MSPLDRARAWLVTGPLGRGLAFAIDFASPARLPPTLNRRCRSHSALRPSADPLGSAVDADRLSQSCPTRECGSRSRFPPRTSSAPLSRAARAMAREMRMPGFRKGKAPPSLVIQRLGFGAGPRGGDPRVAARVVRTGAARLRDQPDRRPRASRWSRPRRARASRSSFKFEVGVRPAAKLGEYKGLEVGRAETEVDRGDRRHRGRADPRGLRPAGAGRARRRRGRLAADRLRGPDRRHGLRGRQGRRTTCWRSAPAS